MIEKLAKRAPPTACVVEAKTRPSRVQCSWVHDMDPGQDHAGCCSEFVLCEVVMEGKMPTIEHPLQRSVAYKRRGEAKAGMMLQKALWAELSTTQISRELVEARKRAAKNSLDEEEGGEAQKVQPWECIQQLNEPPGGISFANRRPARCFEYRRF